MCSDVYLRAFQEAAPALGDKAKNERHNLGVGGLAAHDLLRNVLEGDVLPAAG